MTAQVLVKLAAPDPWSFTVLDTLTRKFGFESIVRVDRVKCWDLVFDAGTGKQAAEITGRILEETVLLANPNRDRWVLRGQPDQPVPSDFWHPSPEAVSVFAVKVTDREDIVGRSIGSILKTRLGMDEIREVRFSTIWLLEMSDEEPEAERLANEIAIAKSWRRGLLANPHYQRAEVDRAEGYFGSGEDPDGGRSE
jgi:phosphoribosylformylglycinamidine (FGAM) synthase PurS component